MATLEKKTLIGLLGQKAGLKLYNFLSDCCNTECCPSEKYVIEPVYAQCTLGNPNYDIYVTSAISLSGVLSFDVYRSTEGADFTKVGSAVLQINGITSGVATLATEGVVLVANKQNRLVLIDSRGNWSTIYEFNSGTCP